MVYREEIAHPGGDVHTNSLVLYYIINHRELSQHSDQASKSIANLALTAVNPLRVLRRVTPSYFYPAPPPKAAPTTTSPPKTAKLSSTSVLPARSGLTFAEPVESTFRGYRQSSPPLCVQSAMAAIGKEKDKRRRRRSSSLMYQEPPESLEQQSDQATMPNLNSQWVNAKGTAISA